MEKLSLGANEFEAYRIPTVNSAILFIKGTKGFLACGYFNIETAEKLGESVAIVTGVKNFDDMLRAEVRKISTAAASAGVKPGMSGLEALELMA